MNPQPFWSEHDPKRRAKLKAEWEANFPERPYDAGAEGWLEKQARHWHVTLPAGIGATKDGDRIVIFLGDKNQSINREILTPGILKIFLEQLTK